MRFLLFVVLASLSLPSLALDESRFLSQIPLGTVLVFKKDMPLPAGEVAFNINDTYLPWKIYGEPELGLSYCAFMAQAAYKAGDLILAGSRFKVTATKNIVVPQERAGDYYQRYMGFNVPYDSYRGTILRVTRIAPEGAELPAPITTILCKRARAQDIYSDINIAAPAIRVERRDEPTIAQFLGNISTYVKLENP